MRAAVQSVIADLWYKNAVIYNLDVDAFMDANGDGCGDFHGLVRRLDYIVRLGATCVWLQPFYPTPNRDNGYDITDFYGVDPRLGTLGDFVEFTHQARARGLRVITDLVINHTSSKHPWFQAARRDRHSKYRDWYVWADKRPRNHDKGMVFPGVQDSTWTYDREARAWYFHRFYDHQPDLNTANPEVRAEIRRVMGFWLELGVSGFRVDALPFVLQGKGSHADPAQDFDFLQELRRFLQWRARDAILLAEANVLPAQNEQYFGAQGAHVQMMFNFWANQHLFYSLAAGDARPLASALAATRLKSDYEQWGVFLRNHDELDLGRLAAPQRKRVFAAFGPEPRMQLYDRGIRRRLAPMFGGDRRKLELAYSLMFTLPGTPVMRYGDEIGMGDDLKLPERQAARTPMQWSPGRNAGFSSAARTAIPVIARGPYGCHRVNVAAQRREPGSLLEWTERIVRTRKECPEFGWGTWRVLATGEPAVLALRYDWKDGAVVAVHNLADRPVSIALDVHHDGPCRLVNLLSADDSEGDARGRHAIDLEALGYRWYRVGGFDDAAAPPRRRT